MTGCDFRIRTATHFAIDTYAEVPLGDSLGFVRYVAAAADWRTAYVITSKPSASVLAVALDGSRQSIVSPDSVLRAISVGSTPDRMWIADDAARRVLILDQGRGAWRWVAVPTIQPRAQPRVVGVLSTGAVITEERPAGADGDTLIRPVVYASGDSALVIDSLLELGGTLDLRGGDGSGGVRFRQPWFYADLAVMATDNSALLILRERPPASSRAEVTVTVEEMRADRSRAAQPWKMAFARTPISDSAVANWVADVLRDSAVVALLGGQDKAGATLRSALFRPACVPPIRRAIAAPDNALLIERTQSQDSLHHWELWTRRGQQGLLTVPREFEIQAVLERNVLAVERKTLEHPERIVLAHLRSMER